MKAFSYWINSILAGIMAFVGLLASSRAADDAFAIGGLIVFLGCVLFIFASIGRYFDRMGSAH
ncbi:hypothetical protein A6A40_10420 [Azospirillum humicireducens]|uniref:Uncharacterized protein n=1 Tax=Azospirillum humicireducens TaxID=1226968 RepID=A0A160JHK2_9PROT|nr:hypothetical protein [Azospirillum humicireducens]ANC92284.1 hypothetical protein A6A40_10420 [Azospirillum humicireducens]